jgi:hypothetical protein
MPSSPLENAAPVSLDEALARGRSMARGAHGWVDGAGAGHDGEWYLLIDGRILGSVRWVRDGDLGRGWWLASNSLRYARLQQAMEAVGDSCAAR